MYRRGLLPLLLVAWASAPVLATHAADIPGLFNTGVDEAGTLLAAGAVDPHWRLVQSPDAGAPGPRAFVVRAGFPIPPWFANGPDSKWISPKADQSVGNAPGDYRYQLTFDLSDLDPETAVITGRWSSDNAGVEVRLNGRATGETFDGNFGNWSPTFTLRSGFVDGTNTLEFVVNNAGDGANPTGFRASLSGTAEASAPPRTPPRITREPEAAIVAFKDAARFRVGASGSKPLRFQWRRDGGPLSGATNASLVLPFVGVSDSGPYDVVVSNDFGSITSKPVALTVTFPNLSQRNREPAGPSSRRIGLAITEIMYHPPRRTDGRELEFIELYNSNPFFEDLTSWRITGQIEFTFPAGTVLGGRQYVVIAAKPSDVSAAYGIDHVLGGWTGRLANEGGGIQLQKPSGGVVLDVVYSDQPPWPLAADGAGHSLVLVRPSYGENDVRAWTASAQKGGSPGSADPAPDDLLAGLEISELYPAPGPGQKAWIELFNRNARPADLSSCTLSGAPDSVGMVVPVGTVVGGGEWVIFDEAQLPSLNNPTGGQWLLGSPNESRVLDMVSFGESLPGMTFGRTPLRPGALRELTQPTPGAANAPPRIGDVVISEIMFHPISDDPADEFVELHNRGSAEMELGGWRFVAGIDYQIPAGTRLAPDGYLVVARDADQFRARHRNLPASAVIGNFAGALSNGGDYLALNRPILSTDETHATWVAAAEAAYSEGSPTRHWTDGGGSSLELADLKSDPLMPDNWMDSIEQGKANWTLVEATGVLNLVHPGVPNADQLQVMLLGAGEALVDNVEVRVGNGGNRVSNGTFESGTGGWFFQGTHRMTSRETTEGFDSISSLHVIATDRGDHVANRIRAPLTSPIPTGQTATIRARVKWLAGHPEILFRLRGGGLETVGTLATSPSPGTPAQPNSRNIPNSGPIITDVIHRPILPAAGDVVRVFAAVSDPDGIAQVIFRYRVDPNTALSSTLMVDDGTGPDELAGDGIYTGAIAAQPTGTLIAFHIEATDAANPGATSQFPANVTDHEGLIRFDETIPADDFGTYRVWMTAGGHGFWANRETMSNEDVPATFVYGGHRVIYESGAHYSGSSYTAPTYNSPTGNLCGYNVSFPDDNRLLGDNAITLDWPIRDDTDQREQLMFWLLEQYGLPNMYRRYVNLFVNGIRRGVIYDDVQQPGGDTVREWFPDDYAGSLWKTDCWNEFDNSGLRIDPCILNTLEEFPANGALKVARYRWNWRPRAVHGTANNFSDLFTLIDAVNASSNYIPTVASLVDVDHWMRTFAMNDLASFWDAFGNGNAKNTFLYKPERAGWKLMCWDFDVGLGVFGDPPNAPLFDVNDPTIQRLFQTPAFVRPYWAALAEAVNGFFRTGAGTPVDRWLDARFAASQAAGLNLGSPAGIKSWINQRRSFLLNQLSSVRANFAITSPVGTDFSTGATPLIIRGTAPVGVAAIRVNGIEFPLDWKTVTSWEMRVPLAPGTNALVVIGVDRLGQTVAGAQKTLQATFTGNPVEPASVYINEWMADNAVAVRDPTDGNFDDWFELFNAGAEPVSLAGWRLSDNLDDPNQFVIPVGFALPPHGYLQVWADRQPEQTELGLSLHVNFRLDHDGDVLGLFDPTGHLVDSIQFGSQLTDVSQGRWPDGTPEPSFFLQAPSPASANQVAPDQQPPINVSATIPAPDLGVTLTWQSLPGRTYQVRYSSELGTDAWIDLPGDVLADGLVATKHDPAGATDRNRFYQVILLERP